MYIRQIVTATALTGFLALFGAFSSVPAMAQDVEPENYYYDFEKGVTVFVANEEEAKGTPVEDADLPSHIKETIETN